MTHRDHRLRINRSPFFLTRVMIQTMVRAIREIVTAGAGGRVQLDVPGLKSGERAEVIVLLGELDAGSAQVTGTNPTDALTRLQTAVNLDRGAADAWANDALNERRASSRL